ncbi:hypothetical protein OPT61_g8951 [Boeremia exigua]|uniref:Uncharacterized protein n=1 Tax=Boeremia exigua TaxID=749465 RepID=A0ACC2HWS8_9PLEO|nr:hypothetical protein OPT61_g8951 [Boeremia exigua]
MAADMLLTSDASCDWSGTGRGLYIDFGVEEKPPLEEGRFLGRGGDAIVHETTVNNCKVAWKRTWRKRKIGTNLKEEIEILKRLSHQHLVRLIGAYSHKRCLGMLLYPVATCDLQTFFEDAEAYWHERDDQKGRTARLVQLGYWSRPPHKHKAWPIYTRIGCLVSALSYLHSQSIQIRHKDLKPSNILLTRDGLYLSDFGHATDFSLLSRSATEGGGGTFRYYSPEVAAFEPAGRASDIFSLGCVLLEVLVFDKDGDLQRLGSSLPPSSTAYYENLDKIDEWLPWDDDLDVLRHHLCLEVRRMLSKQANRRPRADQLLTRLSLCDKMMEATQDPIFADCCKMSYLTGRQYQSHIERLHARVESLEEDSKFLQIEHMQALDSARLSKRVALAEHLEQISILKRENHEMAVILERQYDFESQLLRIKRKRSETWRDFLLGGIGKFLYMNTLSTNGVESDHTSREKQSIIRHGENLIALQQDREWARSERTLENSMSSRLFQARSSRAANTDSEVVYYSPAQIENAVLADSRWASPLYGRRDLHPHCLYPFVHCNFVTSHEITAT